MNFKKLTVLLLALIMVVSVFAACTTTPGKTTPKPTTPKPDTNGGEDVPEEELLNVDIDNIDYDQSVVRVFHYYNTGMNAYQQKEFEVTEDETLSNAINDAVYKKNLYTEQALGITLETHACQYSYNNTSFYIDALKRMVDDPTTPVDIITADSRVMPTVFVEGYLKELSALPDLDYEKAWWPGDMVDCLSIKDRLYFITGDISTNTLAQMICIFLNKKTLEARGTKYEDFMNSVLNYEWTLDKMIELCDGIYAEGSDSKKPGPSVDDYFGFVTTWYYTDGIYNGAGYNYMRQSKSSDKVLELDSDMLSQSVDDYVTKLVDWGDTYDFYGGNTGSTLYATNFMEGRSLFCAHVAMYGNTLQTTELDFAVAPCPLRDADQKEYYSSLGTQFNLYGIASSSPDLDRAAQTIQCLGYYAYQYTTPTLFEVTFKGKYSKDDYTLQMFDLIRNSLIYDPGKIYDSFICGSAGNMWSYYPPNIVSFTICGEDSKEYGNQWKSKFTSSKRNTLEGLIKDANAKLLAAIDAAG